MYNVIMEVNGEEYVYGKYVDRNKANEIAMQIRDERNVDTSVYEAIDEGRNKKKMTIGYRVLMKLRRNS